MNKHLRVNMCDLEEPAPHYTELEGLGERIAEKIPRELQYSCLYWASHLAQAGQGARTPEIVKFFIEFMENHVLHWLEVLSLVDRLYTALGSIRAVEAWWQVRFLSHRLLHSGP